MRKSLLVLMLVLCCSAAFAQTSTIAGQIQTATGGAITSGTLTFSLSQPSIVSGTASLATQIASCYTSAAGNIVGVPDPLVAPVVTTNTGAGTLTAGTYFVEIYYTGSGGVVSVVSPETSVILSGLGTLIIQPPTFQPSSATGYGVAIGATSGSETIQGTVTGFGTFQQSTPLTAGSNPSASNTSSCHIFFSDQLIPTGTYYTVNLINKTGSQVAGFPQSWCTYGGAGATINVSQGAPTGNCNVSGVYYPTPILAVPANGAAQSISGRLNDAIGFYGPLFGAGSYTGTFPGPNPWIDVTDPAYGAKCDGVTNDTTAIQNAINAAAGPTFGGTVFIPGNRTGSCVVTSLNMDNVNNVTIVDGFDPFTGGGNTGKATFKFTGSCNPTACLTVRSAQDVTFQGVKFWFSGATQGPMIDLSHSSFNTDGNLIRFHGGGAIGPNNTVGPIVLDQNTENVLFDQHFTFSNASVFVEGPVNNAAGFADLTVFNQVRFNNPGTAAIQNASITWSWYGSAFILNNSGSNCTAALQYVNGYTSAQNLAFIANEFLTQLNCSTTVSLITMPAGSGNLGGITVSSNLFVGGSNAFDANMTLLTLGNNQQAIVYGNVFSLIGTVFAVGTGDGLDIHQNVYSNINTFLTGTPASGRIVDNNGNFTVFGALTANASLTMPQTAQPSGVSNASVCHANNNFSGALSCQYNNDTDAVVARIKAGGTGLNSVLQSIVLHSAYTNATTTFSTLGDGTRSASFSVFANTDYTLNCDISYQTSAGTAGPKIQITGPSAPTAVLLSAQGGTNATAYADASVTAFSTALTAFGTSGANATNFVLRITAGISNGANAGTVALQLAANGAGTLTVAAGSTCQFQ